MSRWGKFTEDELRTLMEALHKDEGASTMQEDLFGEVQGALAFREDSARKTEEVSQQAKQGSLVRIRSNVSPKYLQGLLLEVEDIIAGRLHCQVVDKASLRGKKYQHGVIVNLSQVEMELP